jgi:phosphatidylglycerophosphatase A
MVAMERMTPTQEQMNSCDTGKVVVDEEVAVLLLIDEANDEKLLKRAMAFWPPE